jgi:peptidoglycan biosynthesis protein MviN/MurJ (putative lipid II flippase)
MSRPVRLALISIALNLLGLLLYAFAVSNVAFQQFTLATEVLSVMGIVNLTLSLIALTKSKQSEGNRRARRVAWASLAVAIGMLLVIGILLLNIWVYNILR